MKGNIFTKTIICIFILLLFQTPVLANPIPVFALLKYIPYSNNGIYERDYATGQYLKYYSVSSGGIYERDYATGQYLKYYSVSSGGIYERDYATRQYLKYYRL